MAESPQGLHDSRFSGLGPHTTTRGASAPAVLGDLAAAERHPVSVVAAKECRPSDGIYSLCPIWHKERQARSRNGLALGSSGSCPSMMVRCKPGPMYGDFPACLTHSRLRAVERGPISRCSEYSRLGGHWPRRPCSLSIVISLPGLPPFLPPGTRGVLVPRAWRSRPDAGLGWAKYNT